MSDFDYLRKIATEVGEQHEAMEEAQAKVVDSTRFVLEQLRTAVAPAVGFARLQELVAKVFACEPRELSRSEQRLLVQGDVCRKEDEE